jgi:hypothetical protein
MAQKRVKRIRKGAQPPRKSSERSARDALSAAYQAWEKGMLSERLAPGEINPPTVIQED